MRILHTSDWHLGISLHNISMHDEHRHFKNMLSRIIRDNNIDIVAVSGDIFDSSVSNSEAIALYNDIVNEICLDLKTPMLVIAGNHDGAARLSSMRRLLTKSRMFVSGKLERDIKPISFEDADFYLIPYFNIDEARYLYPEHEIKNYEDAMNVVCDEIREKMDRKKANIVLSHSFVGGALLSDGERSAAVGTVNIISQQVFKEFSYVALGHIHRKQKLSDNIFYSGSPLKYSIGEANQNKFVLIYDTQTDTVGEIPIIPLNNLCVIEGAYDTLINSEFSEDYVKVIVNDKYVGIEMLESFRSIFPNLIALEGKSISASDSVTTLTMEEVRNMAPLDIVNKFFEENFDAEVEPQQINSFLELLSKSGEEEFS